MSAGMKKSLYKDYPIPASTLVWNLYGAGYHKLGVDGEPERIPVPSPGSDQFLVRIDCVGICYSDVKLIQQGEDHPKLEGFNLRTSPTRPGHEVSFTIVEVGSDLQDQFQIGQRFAVQPEVILGGKSRTYGFNIPGGLAQYQLIGPELLSTDEGVCLVEVDSTRGWSEASLLEPWGSVIAGYDQKRIKPKLKGKMWIIGGNPGSARYAFSRYLDRPERVLLTGIEGELREGILSTAKDVQIKDLEGDEEYPSISAKYAGRDGFDDIVILEPRSPRQVEILISLAARGGKINLVGRERMNKPASLDLQRIHYDHVSIVGCKGTDIAESYQPDRSRRELKSRGTAVFFGAGGPIGQMHFQRALSLANPPKKILAIEKDQDRLNRLRDQTWNPKKNGRPELLFLNPLESSGELIPEIRKCINQERIDDAVVLVPDPKLMEDALSILNDDGMINLFAGTPSGTSISVDLSRVYLGNLQLAGTSGLHRRHQQGALRLSKEGKIDLDDPIAAVGGMYAVPEAIRATEERIFPGRIVIYPQLVDLPLMGIRELGEQYPSVGERLKDGNRWTSGAERELMELSGMKDD